ncbi:MAG: tolB protein, partial [Myxococcota bacterium]
WIMPSLALAQSERPPNPDDLIREFDIIGDDGDQAPPPLPKIGIVPSLSSDRFDVTLHSVVPRDIDLSGEFELLPEDRAPDGVYLNDAAVDIEAWKATGVEAVVKVTGKTRPDGQAELRGQAYLVEVGDKAVYDKTITVAGDVDTVRFASHRISDALIGALTGTPSAFTSQLSFVLKVGKQRQVYVMDSDGHEPHLVSDRDLVALSPAFGAGHELFYAASRNKGPYRVYQLGERDPLTISPRGSVYGLAFNRDKTEVAVAIARGLGINIFRGPDLFHLKPASGADLALEPTWSPTGKLAYAAAGKWSQQIFVDDKAVSPGGLSAASPTFCRHPDGIRLLYMAGWNDNFDLLSTGETGGGTQRITAGRGRNTYPSCSPDGRLVAFFSTRSTGEGPGLYIMRIDGRRPKRISSLMGEDLTWSRLPDQASRR